MNNIDGTTTQRLYEEDYKNNFSGKEDAALEKALDIRKFEIELYWKRATYFWTFIGATLAGFFFAYASASPHRRDLLVILCCLGLVFSVAWFCVNKGSKYWQENWEKHVDMLEDEKIGPLYKTVLSRNKNMGFYEKLRDFSTGPTPFSVSKINQLISFFMIALWVLLLVNVLLPISLDLKVNYFYCFIVFISIVTCISFFKLGGSYSGGYYHEVTLRKSRIKPRNVQ